MPSYEFECSNYQCEANVHIDRAVTKADMDALECPFCNDYMELIYANAEV